MKNLNRMNRWIATVGSLAILMTAFGSSSVLAKDGTSGFSSIFNVFFGTKQGRKEIANCTMDEEKEKAPDFGFLGKAQAIFCHLKNEVGVTGVGTFNGSFSGQADGTGTQPTLQTHVEITEPAGGTTINGVNYTMLGKVWTCDKSKTGNDCTVAANFVPTIYVAWNQTDTTKQAFMVIDNSAFEGKSAGNATIKMVYDLSDGKSGSVQVDAYMSVGGGAVQLRGNATRDANKNLSVTMLMYQASTGSRMSAYLDKPNADGCIYFEGSCGSNGTGCATSANMSAEGDTPGSALYFSITAPGSGARDNTYTASNTTCPYTLPAFPSDVSLTTVSQYTAASLAGTYLSGLGTPSSVSAVQTHWSAKFAFMGFLHLLHW